MKAVIFAAGQGTRMGPNCRGNAVVGTIMGDDVHRGINSSINVGTTIESGTCINPGEFVRQSYRKLR